MSEATTAPSAQEGQDFKALTKSEVLLTRTQAARRLGMSASTIRRMEGVELEPTMIDGRHYFHVEDVDRCRKLSDGEIAAQAFELFEEDKTPVDVVIALRQPAERIDSLHQHWLRLGDYVVVEGSGGKRRIWEDMYGVKLTRQVVQACVQAVLSDPVLRAEVERRSGRPFPVVHVSYR